MNTNSIELCRINITIPYQNNHFDITYRSGSVCFHITIMHQPPRRQITNPKYKAGAHLTIYFHTSINQLTFSFHSIQRKITFQKQIKCTVLHFFKLLHDKKYTQDGFFECPDDFFCFLIWQKKEQDGLFSCLHDQI